MPSSALPDSFEYLCYGFDAIRKYVESYSAGIDFKVGPRAVRVKRLVFP